MIITLGTFLAMAPWLADDIRAEAALADLEGLAESSKLGRICDMVIDDLNYRPLTRDVVDPREAPPGDDT